LSGELAALGAALVWAAGGLMLKPLSARFHPLFLNEIRCITAAFCFAAFLLATGEFASAWQVPIRSGAIAIAGTLIGLGVGESFFVLSLRYIDLARAYPVSVCGYPLITLALAFFFLHEEVSGLTLLGIVLVIGGLYLVAYPQGPLLAGFSPASSREKTGLLFVLLAVLTWGVATVAVKLGTQGLSLSVANFVRLSGAAVLLAPFAFFRRVNVTVKNGAWRSLALAIANGALTFGAGGVLFLLALQKSGAALTSVLSSTSSLFLLPMAVLILKERVTPKLVAGTILSVAGICLTLLPGLIS